MDAAAGPCPVFTAPQEGLAGAIDDMHLDAVGYRVEPQDRIGLQSTLVIRVSSKVTASYNVQLMDCTIAPSIWLISPSGLTT